MRTLQDAIYNWLTIKVVSDFRPEDTAARKTEKMFKSILISEYGLSNLLVTKDHFMYVVIYEQNNKEHKMRFPIELIESMLLQIKNEPHKYMNYPVE